jgi:hypothetical protein
MAEQDREPGAPAGAPALHGSLGDPQHGRGVGHGMALEVHEDEGRPLLERQCGEGLPDVEPCDHGVR